MRIYHLFRDAPFDADHIELMSSAFEDVSKQLGLGRREDAIRDIVAKAILECAQCGIRDPIEMRKCARDVLQIAQAWRRRKLWFAPRAFPAKRIDFVARSNQDGDAALMLSQSSRHA